MNCSIVDCSTKKHASFDSVPYCCKHYSRIKRYGRLNNIRRMDGYRYHPLYSNWKGMIGRCHNPNHSNYNNYGGRGIKVSDRWFTSIRYFIEDMGDKPSSKHSIERIDNNKGYYKDNCRWATSVEQSRNKRISQRNKSGVSGVSWSNERKKWVTSLVVRGERVFQKRFESKSDAIQARKDAELKYW